MQKTIKRNKASIALFFLVVLLSGAIFGILYVFNGGLVFEPFIDAAMYSLRIVTLGFVGGTNPTSDVVFRIINLFLSSFTVVFAIVFVISFLSLISIKKSHKWGAFLAYTFSFAVSMYLLSYILVNMVDLLNSSMDQVSWFIFVLIVSIEVILIGTHVYTFFDLIKRKDIEKVVETKNEERKEQVEEPVPLQEKEEPVQEEPKEVQEEQEENDDEDEDDEDEVEEIIDENGNKKLIIKKVAFATKLKKADDITKQRYNEIKAYLLAYGEKDRLAFSKETFSSHRDISSVLTISGKTIKVYLPLNASDFENSNVRLIDVSNKKKYEKTPAAFRLTSGLAVKKCKALIDIIMSKKDTMLGEIVEKDYAKETLKKYAEMKK